MSGEVRVESIHKENTVRVANKLVVGLLSSPSDVKDMYIPSDNLGLAGVPEDYMEELATLLGLRGIIATVVDYYNPLIHTHSKILFIDWFSSELRGNGQ